MTDSRSNELRLSGRSLAGVMHSVLEREADFRFEAKGCSMSPFIRHLDVITISGLSGGKPATGDVVAALHPSSGKPFVHRVVGRAGDGFIIKGDNCKQADGVFTETAILGIVRIVERQGARVWFGEGMGKRLIAFLSRTGLLNTVLLPFLRKTRNSCR